MAGGASGAALRGLRTGGYGPTMFLLVACTPRRLSITTGHNAFGMWQVFIKPTTALSQRLLMRHDPLNGVQRLHLTHQVLMDAQLNLTANL